MTPTSDPTLPLPTIRFNRFVSISKMIKHTQYSGNSDEYTKNYNVSSNGINDFALNYDTNNIVTNVLFPYTTLD